MNLKHLFRTFLVKSYIAKRLVIATVVFSSLITLIITSFQVYSDYQRRLSAIDHTLKSIETSILGSLASNVWHLNKEQVQTQLDGITGLPDIIKAEITSDIDEQWLSESGQGKQLIERSYTLFYTVSTEDLPIAQLNVTANLDDVYKQLLDDIVIILISNCIKTFLVSIFILLIFHTLVTRHLEALHRYVKQINLSDNKQDDTVRLNYNDPKNEIHQIAIAIQEMKQKLQDSFKALKSNEARLAEILNNAQAVIYLKESNGQYLFINKHYETLLHLKNEEIIGKTDYDIFPQETADHFRNNDLYVASTGELLTCEEAAPQEDGIHTYISVKFPLFDDQDNIYATCGISTDITQRVKIERELAYIQTILANTINAMPSALIVVDSGLRITQWNIAAKELTGLHSQEVKGRELSPSFIPMLGLSINEIKQAIDSRETLFKQRKSVLHNNQLNHYDITLYPLSDASNQGAVIRIDNISERVHLEEMIVQSEKMMSVGGLAAGMAHEINNPLAGILQNIQVLQNRLSKELPKNIQTAEEIGVNIDHIHDYLKARGVDLMIDSIMDSGQRASKIVQNMLSFSRRSDSKMLKVSLSELVNKTIGLANNDYDLKKNFDFRTIKVTRDYEEQLPLITCEASEIQQVILNILQNSAHAMTEAKIIEPEISIKIKRSDNLESKTLSEIDSETTQSNQQQDYLVLNISDNGPGMPEEIRKRVFEPFFTTKSVGKGTGLGLSVSYFIIADNHHGNIEVHSSEGAGTEFEITLPVNQPRPLARSSVS
jgi:PAS domain S-box-containing protein